MNKKKHIWVFIGLFYALNILNTYFVTTSVLNRYLVPFKRSGFLEINSLIGNFFALSILLLIGFILFKTLKKRMLYLVILTLLLNIAIFSIGIFTKYYQTMFSIYELTLFNNPASELAGSILIQALTELYLYYRIIVFIPFVTLAVYFIAFFKKYKDMTFESIIGRYLAVMGVCVSLVFTTATLGIVKTHMDKVWPISAERTLYGVQSAGLYNFYLGQFMGFNLSNVDNTVPSLSVYDTYNKNKETYTNFFSETYSKNLTYENASSVTVDPSLINGPYLNGILKDKNLVVIHLETFNHFLLDETGPYLDESYFNSLKALLKESYVFDNFYTNVGIGNSSDAEFTAMTGLYPQGDTTIYWKYNNHNLDFHALPELFDGYYKASLHGDTGLFYNRIKVHEEMLGFDDYYYFDEKEDYFEGTKNGYYYFDGLTEKNTEQSPWLSDYALLNWTKVLADRSNPYFLYPITIQPHTPYLYDPYPNQFDKNSLDVDPTTLSYLNYETYYDRFFDEFLAYSKTQTNTAYFFYGDHGSGIPKKDLETILGKELSILDYKQEMIKTLGFIYVPDDQDQNCEISRGLLTGSQSLVRSQVDLYRTIVDLYGIDIDTHYYGVNLLSDEHTFSIDTRAFDIVTDDYFLLGKYIYSDKVPNESNTRYLSETVLVEPYSFFEQVLLFKKRMDIALNLNLHPKLKK
ncbi:MAG: sulfatase-like hydrolase/transferase [Acholeplasma sp.]|nr:sulfatase-like hydrolase/transferase [Acholeplasma sp.]